MAKGMTFVEAHDFEKPALWIDAAEEFMLNPGSGIVSWRPRSEGEAQHGDSWRPVPSGRVIPQEGWSRGPMCDCAFCR